MSVAVTTPITRDEFERVGARLTALEASRATSDTDEAARDEGAPPAHKDYVRQEEFRLFKWLGSFALVAVLGGFGLLYEQTSDLRVAMERLHADLSQEMHALDADLSQDMHARHADLSQEMHALHASTREDMHALHASTREDMHAQHTATRSEIAGVRSDMHAELAGIREDMHAQHAAIRSEIAGVRERVVRLETLGGAEDQ